MTTVTLLLAVLAFATYQLGRQRALRVAGGPAYAPDLHSRPNYHGYFIAIRGVLPALAIVSVWLLAEEWLITRLVIDGLPAALRDRSPGELDLLLNTIRNVASDSAVVGATQPGVDAAADRYLRLRELSGLSMFLAAAGFALLSAAFALRHVSLRFRARDRVETILTRALLLASGIALLTTFGIVMSVLFEALRFFGAVPLMEFLFGTEWSPQTAIRTDQVGSSARFGAVPLFAGTLLVSALAIAVALPLGLMTAVYLSEYASRRARAIAKPLLEVLAGIPTVVYGFFAATIVGPALRDAGDWLGIGVAAESALAAGLVMGVMILPLVSSLSEDALSAVPRTLRSASLALGATRSETIVRVMMPAALPGIVGGVLLAVSRAIGETMIVVMAAGLAANLTANPLAAVTTVTVQIVTLLVGDQEFASAKTLAAFALGLVLFIVTLALNVIGLRVVRRYRQRYS